MSLIRPCQGLNKGLFGLPLPPPQPPQCFIASEPVFLALRAPSLVSTGSFLRFSLFCSASLSLQFSSIPFPRFTLFSSLCVFVFFVHSTCLLPFALRVCQSVFLPSCGLMSALGKRLDFGPCPEMQAKHVV